VRTRQRLELKPANPKTQIPVIVLVASAVVAIALMASIRLFLASEQQDVLTLKAEIEALSQEEQAIRQDLASLIDRLETLEQIMPQMSTDVATLKTDIEALREDQIALRSEIENLSNEMESLNSSRLLEETPAVAEIRLNVPRDKQDYSLTCESSAASMVANFYGVPLSEGEIIAALPRDENPNLGFRGRLDGAPGGLVDYGVYAEPIRKILTAHGLEATPIEGGVDGIRRALDRRHPVIAWITFKLRVEQPVEIALSSGEKVKMVNYEHTVVVTGYNEQGFWVNDPYDGLEHFYATADFARAFGYLDNMALEVAP